MILPIVHAMQTSGIYLATDALHDLAIFLKQEENRVTQEVTEMVGKRVNLSSPDQVADLLFRNVFPKNGIKVRFELHLTPTGKREVVNDKVMSMLKHYHPVVPLIIEFTEYNTIRTGFAETLPNFVDAAGRVHGQFKLTRVVTGRMAMSNPNLLGIPTRSDIGKMIEKSFKAPKGRMMGKIDLSQSQMRIAAHVSQCMNMIDIFYRKKDIHKETASKMFRIPVPELNDMLHRHPAKRTGFGVLFMITAAGLQDQIQALSDPKWTKEEKQAHVDYWSIERCGQLLLEWYAVNPEIKVWQDEMITRVRRYGCTWGQFGRPRLIPAIRSSHRHIRQDAEREAANTPIVSDEVGIMKLGMAQIWQTIQDNHWDVKPLCQIHDALLLEGDDNLPHYMKKFQDIYANVAPLDVPLLADAKCGYQSWGDLK